MAYIGSDFQKLSKNVKNYKNCHFSFLAYFSFFSKKVKKFMSKFLSIFTIFQKSVSRPPFFGFFVAYNPILFLSKKYLCTIVHKNLQKSEKWLISPYFSKNQKYGEISHFWLFALFCETRFLEPKTRKKFF